MMKLLLAFCLLAAAAADETCSRPETEDVVLVQMKATVGNRVRYAGRSSKAADHGTRHHAKQDPEAVGAVAQAKAKESHNQLSAMTGVAKNAEGDLEVFMVAVGTNIFIGIFCIVVFAFLRHHYPIIYEHNALDDKRTGLPRSKIAQELRPTTWYDCLWAGWTIDLDTIMATAGLDQAMMVCYFQFGMRLMLLIGIPAMLVLLPMHAGLGARGAGADVLGRLGFANVEEGSWECWPHAVFVWYVVAVTHWLILHTNTHEFAPRRTKWLLEMPDLRASTMLVEDIPDDVRHEASMREFFNDSFGSDVVESLVFVKYTAPLLQLVDEYANKRLEVAKLDKKCLEDPSEANQSERKLHQAELAEKLAEVKAKQAELLADDNANADTAFVKFKTRHLCEIALKIRYTEDVEEFNVSAPPDPMDARYADYSYDGAAAEAQDGLGLLLIGGLFFGFLPLIIGTSAFLNLESLRDKFKFVDDMAEEDPDLEIAWNAMAGSLALTGFMAMLPTFLVIIFDLCYRLKSNGVAQHKLQQIYYIFLFIFVLLVTAVGESLTETAVFLLKNPTEIFSVLSESLPESTHFYLSFIALSWSDHTKSILRYFPLGKYWSFRAMFDEDKAKELSEPEDQDFYGLGSRNARNTLTLVIALVLCSLHPIITLLTFVSFAIGRVIYCYLVVFSETQKPDLGGEFWTTSLKHTQGGLLTYVLVMTGVLLEKGGSPWIGVTASSSIALWWYGCKRFETRFNLQSLPLIALKNLPKQSTARTCTRPTYEQPELLDFEEHKDDRGVKLLLKTHLED